MKEEIKKIFLLIKEHFPFFFIIVITLCIIFNIYIYKYYKNEDDYVLPKFTNVSISIDGGRQYKQNIMMFNNSFVAFSDDLLSINYNYPEFVKEAKKRKYTTVIRFPEGNLKDYITSNDNEIILYFLNLKDNHDNNKYIIKNNSGVLEKLQNPPLDGTKIKKKHNRDLFFVMIITYLLNYILAFLKMKHNINIFIFLVSISIILYTKYILVNKCVICNIKSWNYFNLVDISGSIYLNEYPTYLKENLDNNRYQVLQNTIILLIILFVLLLFLFFIKKYTCFDNALCCYEYFTVMVIYIYAILCLIELNRSKIHMPQSETELRQILKNLSLYELQRRAKISGIDIGEENTTFNSNDRRKINEKKQEIIEIFIKKEIKSNNDLFILKLIIPILFILISTSYLFTKYAILSIIAISMVLYVFSINNNNNTKNIDNYNEKNIDDNNIIIFSVIYIIICIGMQKLFKCSPS